MASSIEKTLSRIEAQLTELQAQASQQQRELSQHADSFLAFVEALHREAEEGDETGDDVPRNDLQGELLPVVTGASSLDG